MHSTEGGTTCLEAVESVKMGGREHGEEILWLYVCADLLCERYHICETRLEMTDGFALNLHCARL